MPTQFRKAMDALYLVCVFIAGVALVLISAVIPWAVYTRYVLNSAASWPEPMAVLLTIVLTFFGAAACYRLDIHMNVGLFADALPDKPRQACRLLVELLMTVVAVFMLRGSGRLSSWRILPCSDSSGPVLSGLSFQGRKERWSPSGRRALHSCRYWMSPFLSECVVLLSQA